MLYFRRFQDTFPKIVGGTANIVPVMVIKIGDGIAYGVRSIYRNNLCIGRTLHKPDLITHTYCLKQICLVFAVLTLCESPISLNLTPALNYIYINRWNY